MVRKPKPVEELEGYRMGDITYCIDPKTNEFFPVRIVNVDRRSVDVEPLFTDLSDVVSPEFQSEGMNRKFMYPKLPSYARFGGCDDRTVNTDRISGQELRLLPYHYGTYTGIEIKKRHRIDPERWPLPTGTVYERWFKEH